MVIGKLIVEQTTKVKNNPYYGNYESKTTHTHTLVNEKYVGLVSPKTGIHITIKGGKYDSDIDMYISKYYFEGELEKDADKDTIFSTSFGFNGNIYEVNVDVDGQLVCVDEWLSSGDYEDGNDADNHYTKKSRSIKWELIDM